MAGCNCKCTDKHSINMNYRINRNGSNMTVFDQDHYRSNHLIITSFSILNCSDLVHSGACRHAMWHRQSTQLAETLHTTAPVTSGHLAHAWHMSSTVLMCKTYQQGARESMLRLLCRPWKCTLEQANGLLPIRWLWVISLSRRSR